MIKSLIKKGEYYDSVSLMIVGKKISEEFDIKDAAVVMATKENKEILKLSDLYTDKFDACTDTDLIIVLKHTDEKKLDEIFPKVEKLLRDIRKKSSDTANFEPKSLEGALKMEPSANLALISIAGRYAGDVAMDALKNGLNVMLFSDNVSLETEIKLKKYAVQNDLLMMGPDCGTSIINGVPLAFANAVNKGNIAIISASGTGLQEVSTIISDAGFGISQAIGTGGRDLKKEVGGMMFLASLKALSDDENTKLIVLISKPPHKSILSKINNELKNIDKKIVAVFLGISSNELPDFKGEIVSTLEEASLKAISIIGNKPYELIKNAFYEDYEDLDVLSEKLAKEIGSKRKFIRGLFSGGTLCDEAQIVINDYIDKIYTNRPLKDNLPLDNLWKSTEHTLIDLGEDEFTVGRLHPMIDFDLRNKRILLEAQDKETAVILLDLVIGFGANKEPLKELLPTIKKVTLEHPDIKFVCSVTGTENDPQNKEKIIGELQKAGVVVMPSNAAAALLSAKIIKKMKSEEK